LRVRCRAGAVDPTIDPTTLSTSLYVQGEDTTKNRRAKIIECFIFWFIIYINEILKTLAVIIPRRTPDTISPIPIFLYCPILETNIAPIIISNAASISIIVSFIYKRSGRKYVSNPKTIKAPNAAEMDILNASLESIRFCMVRTRYSVTNVIINGTIKRIRADIFIPDLLIYS
jgi:hypothetical protein